MSNTEVPLFKYFLHTSFNPTNYIKGGEVGTFRQNDNCCIVCVVPFLIQEHCSIKSFTYLKRAFREAILYQSGCFKVHKGRVPKKRGENFKIQVFSRPDFDSQ